MTAQPLTCVFLGYLWKVARAIEQSPHATLIAAGVEPQRARSAEAIEYYEASQTRIFDARKDQQFGRAEELIDSGIDLLVVGAFGQILPSALISRVRLGAINVHCSLLPEYRGGCPIEEQILAGETHGGVTLHWMTDEVDAGPIVAAKALSISPDDSYADIFERCHAQAELLLADLLTQHPSEWNRTPQAFSTPVRKPRSADDGVIDWNVPALDVRRLVLADGWRRWVRTRVNEGDVVVEEASLVDGAEVATSVPGRVLIPGEHPVIETRRGAIQLVKWSSPRPLIAGEILGSKGSTA